MTMFTGRIQRERHYVKVLTNSLPENIRKINGEYFQVMENEDLIKLEMKTVDFHEFFGFDPE